MKSHNLTPDGNKNVRIILSKISVFVKTIRSKLLELAERFRFSEEDIIVRTLRNLKALNYKFNMSGFFDHSKVTGIDLLIAITNMKNMYCDIHESRIFELLRIVSNSRGVSYDSDHIALFVERFCMHITQARITEPFWDTFVEFLYEYKIFPEIVFNLNQYGVRLINFLIQHAEEYIELEKYEWLKIKASKELVDEIQSRCEFQYDRFYERDKTSSLFISDTFF